MPATERRVRRAAAGSRRRRSTPSPASRAIRPIQRRSRRRDGRRADERVPQVEHERQQRRPDQARDLHRPQRRRPDGDRRRVRQRRPQRVADVVHPQRRRPVPEQTGDERRRPRRGRGGCPRRARRPDRARPPGTIAATPVKARNATSRRVTSSDVRSSAVSAGQAVVDPALERERPLDDEPGDGERRDEPQPERARAGWRRDRRPPRPTAG